MTARAPASRVTVIVLVLLVLGQAAVGVISERRQDFHARMDFVARLGSLALARYPVGAAARAIPRRGGLRVVLYGDSRAAAWPALTDSSIEVLGRGIDGQTSEQLLARYGVHVAPLAPDVVVIQAGVNDVARISAGADAAEVVARAAGNLAALVDAAHQQGTTVILTTIFPLLADRSRAQRDGLPWGWPVVADTAITRLNAIIQHMAAPDVVIFDAATLLAAPDGYLSPAYARDIAHLNAAGYDALNARLAALLRVIPRRVVR